MNKVEIINLVKSLNLPLGEYSICSTGSLVVREIYDKAGDLDLQLTEKCFEYMKNNGLKYNFIEKKENNHLFYGLDDYDVEFFVMPLEEIYFDYVDGYPCQKVEEILKFKKERNLPKDQEPIALMESYLKEKILKK